MEHSTCLQLLVQGNFAVNLKNWQILFGKSVGGTDFFFVNLPWLLHAQ